MSMAKSMKVPRGTARRKARQNITAWKERRDARCKMLSANPEERFQALKVLAHLEREAA